MKEHATTERFSVPFVLANNRDIVQAQPGVAIPEGVKPLALCVLEELDRVADCTTQTLRPREPDSILTEIESCGEPSGAGSLLS